MATVKLESLNRDTYFYLAKLAEQGERYKEMVDNMKKLVLAATKTSEELTVEERVLLSAAYKRVTGSLRESWRIMSSIEQKKEKSFCSNDKHVGLVKGYRWKVESELIDVCNEILMLLEDYLIPSASDSESKVFYLKMKGDYYRYIAEFKVGDERKKAADDAMSAYQAAQDIAVGIFAPTDPIRLGLALNFSVFYYEILNQSEKACNMAREAFEDANIPAELVDFLSEDSYKDTILILHLLRDNIMFWTLGAN